MQHPFRILIGLAAALVVAPLAFPTPAMAAKPPPVDEICRRAIAPIARVLRLLPRLLDAISLVETGRWDAVRRASFAWPWTVYAEGKGRYLPTKAAAIAAVRRLQARGVRNIDVGCMQINLHYHGDAFADLEQMFDPGRNVVYAARMLKRLRRVKRSWSRAVAIYHSSTRALGRPYWKKVYAMWQGERRRAWDRLRRLRRDGYRERGRRVAAR
jgi:hypothetical protein